MRCVLRWFVFQYSILTGHCEFCAKKGTLKFKFFNWLYEGDAEPEFDVIMPDDSERGGTE